MNYSRRPSQRIGVEKILYRQHLERLKNVEPVTDCYFYGPKIDMKKAKEILDGSK